jgi:uroporphyrinogen-III synthase
MEYFEQSDEQQVAEILRELKGHPDFVIANRIVNELEQRLQQRQAQVIQQTADFMIPQTPSHLHKSNRDGTFDAICLRCFMTIGSAPSIANLGPAENQHVCDPIVMSRRANHLLETTRVN